jgi:hypothetical protein
MFKVYFCRLHQSYYFRKYDRVVLVVRDPLRAAMADFSRKNGVRNTTTHKAVAPLEVYETEAWPEFARIRFHAWSSFLKHIPRDYAKDKVCTIIYEELLEDVVRGAHCTVV